MSNTPGESKDQNIVTVFVLPLVLALCIGFQTCYIDRSLKRFEGDLAARGELAKKQADRVIGVQAAHDTLLSRILSARRERDIVGVSGGERANARSIPASARAHMDSANTTVVAQLKNQYSSIDADRAILRGTPYSQLFRAQLALLKRYYYAPLLGANRDSLEKAFKDAYEESAVSLKDFSEASSLVAPASAPML